MAWRTLEATSRLERSQRQTFGASVRLLINSQCKAFSERFRKGDGETLQMVMSDVIVQISRAYLRQGDHLDSAAGYIDRTSLSGVAQHWIQTAFGSTETARRALDSDPGRFHARMNAVAALGEVTE
jgi:hypothetical protein